MKNKKQTVAKQCMMTHENVKCLNPCFWSISKSCYSSAEMA